MCDLHDQNPMVSQIIHIKKLCTMTFNVKFLKFRQSQWGVTLLVDLLLGRVLFPQLKKEWILLWITK